MEFTIAEWATIDLGGQKVADEVFARFRRAANSELGNLFGKQALDTVVFLGEPRSMASTLIGERVILCVLFDKKSTLGLVRLRSKRAVQALTPVFAQLFERLGLTPPAEVPATALDLDADSQFRLEA